MVAASRQGRISAADEYRYLYSVVAASQQGRMLGGPDAVLASCGTHSGRPRQTGCRAPTRAEG